MQLYWIILQGAHLHSTAVEIPLPLHLAGKVLTTESHPLSVARCLYPTYGLSFINYVLFDVWFDK